MKERAAQFSSFAALTGHAAAIRETERQVQRRLQQEERGVEPEETDGINCACIRPGPHV